MVPIANWVAANKSVTAVGVCAEKHPLTISVASIRVPTILRRILVPFWIVSCSGAVSREESGMAKGGAGGRALRG